MQPHWWDRDGRTRSADGTMVKWVESGTGPPLVLVHGGLLGLDMWKPLIRLLRSHFRCILVGRRGYGLTESESPYSYVREYEDVAAVIAALPPPIALFGYSSGAIVSLGAALMADVAHLVAFEPPLPIPRPLLGDRLAAAEAAIAAGDVEAAVRIGLVDGVGVPPEVATVMLADPSLGRAARTGGAQWIREFAQIDQLGSALDDYRGIRAASVLLLRATETERHHTQAVEALARVLPRAAVADILGHGHMVAISGPDQVAAAVVDFVFASS